MKWMHYTNLCPWRNVDVEQSGVTGLDSCHGDPHRFTSISRRSRRYFENVAELSILVIISLFRDSDTVRGSCQEQKSLFNLLE